ncbi:hypothetical protein WK68_18800 [Burkholderia ubonensis]|nr:hypothetical protein WJ75_19690 [Burkholderia ubonensis]KVU36038.1 hypothetical protein WK68_18800 [Burkholderia ubonensis]
MACGFHTAFACKGEIEIGLDQARADGAGRRFDCVGKHAIVSDECDDDVFALWRWFQVQRGCQSIVADFCRIEILDGRTAIWSDPVGGRERRECRGWMFRVACAEYVARSLFQRCAMECRVERVALSCCPFIDVAPRIDHGTWFGQTDALLCGRSPFAVEQTGAHVAHLSDADPGSVCQLGNFPRTLRGAQHGAKHACRLRLEQGLQFSTFGGGSLGQLAFDEDAAERELCVSFEVEIADTMLLTQRARARGKIRGDEYRHDARRSTGRVFPESQQCVTDITWLPVWQYLAQQSIWLAGRANVDEESDASFVRRQVQPDVVDIDDRHAREHPFKHIATLDFEFVH